MATIAKNEKIGIVGSGLIGRSWAMLFASVGYKVALYDIQATQVEKALADIKLQLEELNKNGLLKGNLTPEEQFAKIQATTTLEECVKGAKYVQECTPEVLQMKQDIFSKLDKLADDDTILASSTSCLLPSSFSEDLKHRNKVVIAHPVNPPYYVPLVEIVPAPWTDPSTVEDTKNIMKEIGQSPVTLRKEIPGFLLNRIQYAIFAEAWRLLEDGFASAEDIDAVMSEGLGMRYAFLGIWETAHLNAEGIEDYMKKFAKGISSIINSFGRAAISDEGVTFNKLDKEMKQKVSLDELQERRLWRDKRVAALAKLKKEMK